MRVHTKDATHDKLIDNINFTKSYFNKIIYLHPSKNTLLWSLNNQVYKIWDNFFKVTESDYNNHFKMWGVDSIDSMRPWQLREFISMNLFTAHEDYIDFAAIDYLKQNNNNILFVSIDDLRDNFAETLLKIATYCDFEIVNRDKINFIYNEWSNCQYHKNKDTIVNHIVECILKNIDFSWEDENLTIIDEAYIQMKLAANRIQIKCFELDNFPKSTKSLFPLLYAT